MVKSADSANKATSDPAKPKVAVAKRSAKASKATSSFPVIGIGASAGGLTAVTQLLKHLPARIGMAVVVIQHLDPKHGSLTAEILSRISPMPVAEVKDGTRIQPDNVYVIPPNYNLRLSKGVLKLSPRLEARQHLPIDLFFQSLADEKKDEAIGVVLSGIASDGTLGLRAIKSEDGLTFAQDPKTAQYDGMPRSAILSGAVDIVASPQGIAEEIGRISHLYPFQQGVSTAAAQGRELGPAGYHPKILTMLRKTTGVDFGLYKPSTIQRRISRRQFLLKIPNLQNYVQYLADHPEEVKTLFNDILIQVTSFFRDPGAFDSLKTHILPKILKNWDRKAPFRVWVPGCSTGEEAYSIAIVFFEFLDKAKTQQQIQIFASDISEAAIHKARAAVYPETITKDVSRARLRRFFEKTEGGYRIAKWVREICLFSRQDVTTDPPFARIDLVSCRNLLIYFTSELQKRVVPILHYALNPGGILWLGRSETISGFPNLFAIEDKLNKFYSKKTITTPARVEFPPARHTAKPVVVLPRPVALVSLQDVQQEADRIAIREYAPPGVVINDAFEILQVRGRPAPYLELTSGQASLNVFKLARPEIVADLRYLIGVSRREDKSIKRDGLSFKYNGDQRFFSINVIPLPLTLESKERCFSIFFEDTPRPQTVAPSSAKKPGKSRKRLAEDQRVAQQQIAEEQRYQQSLIEEYETTQEELTSANEELQSTNEELQSTNEELETAKEELQSANEEMTTVNDELQNRNAEMTQLSNDLTNLLASMDIPVVMVGPDARIRRFTPKAGQTLRLTAGDIGRAISDIETGLKGIDLYDLVSSTMSSMTLHEIETEDKRGSWYRLQIRPYRTADNKIDGAVISMIDITASKHAADLVKSARDDARTIIETTPSPVLVITADRRVQVANESFCETFRSERSEIEGKFISELGDGQWNIPSLLRLLEAVLNQGTKFKDFEVELDLPRVGHKSLVLNARRTYLAGAATQAALLAIEDATVRKEIARELKSTEERYRNLLEGAHDGIVVVNRKGLIVFANRRAEAMFGYSAGELNDKYYEILVPEERREVHRSYLASYMRDPQARDMESPERLELYARRKDGFVFPVDISLSPVKSDSEATVTAIIRDISQRKMIEKERLEMMASEKEARLEAEKANRMKDEFLATLSHELRTPLTTIKSWAQILRLGLTDPERAMKGVTVIERSANSQSQLIDDLLDVSRIQSGKLHLDLSVVDPVECVSAAVDSVRSLAEEKAISIETEFDPSPGKISADPVRLQQVFSNLLTNAIKFTPQRGEIGVQLKRVGEPPRQSVQIQVKDTGKGIKADFIPHLFTRFTQADSSSTRGYAGLGLGLSIVRHLVEMHGGIVTAESPGEEKGSVFTVNLPLEQTNLQPGENTVSSESLQVINEKPGTPAKLDGLKVLIIDDVKDTRDGFGTFLQSLGADVKTAASAAEGFGALTEFKPDVLLCDIAMPGEDGYSLIQRVRALEPGQGGKTAAIAVTAYAGVEDIRRALEAKYDAHVAKPLDMVALSHRIGKLARKKTP